MTYHLGIDLGTTYVGAALVRDGRAEIITLGDRAAVVPSVLFFKDDGQVLTGDAAIRRGLSDPTRVVREFKRRVGDTTPVVVGATPYSADSLMSELLRRALTVVIEREGSEPAGIGITHPANWGPYKTDLLNQAIRMAEVAEALTLTEPEAAAIHYARTERVEPGGLVAVYDLGGGTFDVAVLRKTGGDRQFELLGDAEGIERLGGIDFDEAVFQHTMRWAQPALSELDPNEPATLQAVARLRQECVAAKEALSSDTEAAVPIMLPNLQTEVRLTRSEFEQMIRPAIARTIEAMRRGLRTGGVTPDDLTAVLLVGGSSRIPLIAQMVGAELGRPIAVDVHPKHTVALGAAIAAASAGSVPGFGSARATGDSAADAGSAVATLAATEVIARIGETPQPAQVVPADPASDPQAAGVRSTMTDTPPVLKPPQAVTDAEERPRWLLAVAGVAAILMIAVGAFALSRAGADPDEALAAEVPVTTEAAVSEAPATDSLGAAVQEVPTTIAATVIPTAATDTASPAEPAAAAGGDEVEPTATTQDVTTTTPPTSAATTTTVPTAEALVVTIESITVVDGAYSVAYSTNFDPLISNDPASNHIHFFFDVVDVTAAGVPGPGPWKLYDTPAPFTGYTVADRPAAATQLCATAATAGHAVVDTDRFSCMELPDA